MCVYIVSKHQTINRRQCQVLGEALTALFGDSQKRGRRGERQEAGGEKQEARGAPHWEEPGDFRLKGSGGDSMEEKIPGRVFAKFLLSFMYSPRTALLAWNYTGLLYSYSSNNIIILVILLRARITYS